MARVLIIDDEQALREVWALGLRDFGHRVETAENGVEFLKRIRATEPDVPIVVVTAASDPALEKSVIEAGANAILFKPIGLEELANVIRRFVGENP